MKYQPRTPFVKKEFAVRLKNLRRDLRVTQGDLADLIGISRRAYIEWENVNSRAYPQDLAVVVSLCEILETTPNYLLTGIFEAKKEALHAQRYLSIYDRYIGSENFNYLVRMIMELDEDYIKLISDFVETYYDMLQSKLTQL